MDELNTAEKAAAAAAAAAVASYYLFCPRLAAFLIIAWNVGLSPTPTSFEWGLIYMLYLQHRFYYAWTSDYCEESIEPPFVSFVRVERFCAACPLLP